MHIHFIKFNEENVWNIAVLAPFWAQLARFWSPLCPAVQGAEIEKWSKLSKKVVQRPLRLILGLNPDWRLHFRQFLIKSKVTYSGTKSTPKGSILHFWRISLEILHFWLFWRIIYNAALTHYNDVVILGYYGNRLYLKILKDKFFFLKCDFSRR